MKKHKLTICCGTSCYLAAGNRIDRIEHLIKENFGDRLEVVPSACLGQCMKHSGNPPYVRFDGDIISDATDENIIKELKSRLD